MHGQVALRVGPGKKTGLDIVWPFQAPDNRVDDLACFH